MIYLICDRGETPIEKNIIVVDENGNEYEATYPKRAKGLVKNGRARFIEEKKICLAVSPHNETEDNKMSENNITNEEKNEILYTVEYILSKIAELQADTAYLNEALTKLSNMNDGDSGDPGSPGNISGAEKAKAFGDIVRCRETTNQQMIKFYEKMYDDLKPKQPIETERIAILKTVIETLGEGMTPSESKNALTGIVQVALQDLTKNL